MTEHQANLTPPVKIASFIDEDENTRLHHAAASGNIENVTKEIEAGHEIDPVNYLGWTPLMMATRHGHREVVELLLKKRADSTRENNFRFSVFLMAVASGNLEVLHLILQHLLNGGVSRQSMQSVFSPISLAVLFSNVKALQYLIEKSFCVNTASSVGITPLAFASAMGNSEIINLLMARGARGAPKASPNQQPKNVSEVKQIAKPPLLNIPPMILVHQPCFTPQPSFINLASVAQMPRKCSDLASPCFSANISPLTGGFVQQVFFPQNFSPHQFVSPGPVFANNNEFLNMSFVPVGQFYSPVPYNSV